jgi:hypothetical protein
MGEGDPLEETSYVKLGARVGCCTVFRKKGKNEGEKNILTGKLKETPKNVN